MLEERDPSPHRSPVASVHVLLSQHGRSKSWALLNVPQGLATGISDREESEIKAAGWPGHRVSHSNSQEQMEAAGEGKEVAAATRGWTCMNSVGELTGHQSVKS